MELAIGLTVAAIIMAAIMLFFQSASENKKAKETLDLITHMMALVSEYRQTFPQPAGPDLTMDYTRSFAEMNLFPSKWSHPDGITAATPFGTHALASGTTKNSFTNFYPS